MNIIYKKIFSKSFFQKSTVIFLGFSLFSCGLGLDAQTSQDNNDVLLQVTGEYYKDYFHNKNNSIHVWLRTVTQNKKKIVQMKIKVDIPSWKYLPLPLKSDKFIVVLTIQPQKKKKLSFPFIFGNMGYANLFKVKQKLGLNTEFSVVNFFLKSNRVQWKNTYKKLLIHRKNIDPFFVENPSKYLLHIFNRYQECATYCQGATSILSQDSSFGSSFIFLLDFDAHTILNSQSSLRVETGFLNPQFSDYFKHRKNTLSFDFDPAPKKDSSI